MLAGWQLPLMSFLLWKPKRVTGLFSSDGMCPRRLEAEFAGSFLGGLFGGRFDHRAQRIA